MAPTVITAIMRPAGPSPPLQEQQTALPGRETILETSRCQGGNDMHHACQERNRGQECLLIITRIAYRFIIRGREGSVHLRRTASADDPGRV
jgi:hypothetical protein